MIVSKRYFLLVFALILFCHFESRSQNNNRSFLSVTGGYSLPVGELAKEKTDDPFAGLAGWGYHGGLNYDLRAYRWLGFKVSASMNRNKTRPEPIVDIANSYVDEIKALINETSSHTWDTRVSRWKFDAIMAGPAVFLNFKRMRLEGHVQCGYVHITTPSVDMVGTFESGNNQILVRLDRESLGSFGMGTGVSLRLPVSGPLYFHLSADFLATKAELSNVAVNVQVGTYPQVAVPVDEKRFVGVANVGAGLGISF